jgi:hypothetical protein
VEQKRLKALITEDLEFGEGYLARELNRLLHSCEHPGFTLGQVAYWLGNHYHSGQHSKGYQLLCCGYKPSLNESVESLIEIDYEFEAVYNYLNSWVATGKLHL